MLSWRDTLKRVDRRLLAGAGIALVLLAVSGFLSLQNARHLIATTSRVNGIHATLARENELLALLNQAEGGLFSYVIAAETNYLTPYHVATSSIPAMIEAVRGGLEGHDDVAPELQRLEQLIAVRLEQMRDRLVLMTARGPSAVADVVKRGEARVLMAEIRSSIATLNRHEVQRLSDMEVRAVNSARRTLLVDVLFGTVSVLSLAVIFAWLMRENVTRRKSEEDLRKAGHELELRVAERTADLATANACLQREIEERTRAEETTRLSEQKLAEAARALEDKNKDLEMLIYVASHDLRAPLLNIRGFASELMRSCTDVQKVVEQAAGETLVKADVMRALEDVPESANFIQAGVAKVDTLLSGFLRLSRLGRAALRIGRVDMTALLETVVQSFEFQIRSASGEIHVARLPRCMADSTQVTQVFSNLIDNAIKYRDPSRPLRVEITGALQGSMVAYRVKDNGSGIPADHLDKVFEIFHRVHPRESEGEGLGLTIARRIIDRLNGRIQVESRAGEGSVFTVFLPVAERESEKPRDSTAWFAHL
jgi:signal transduction histidine kinase